MIWHILTYLDGSSRLASFICEGNTLVPYNDLLYGFGSWPSNSDFINCSCHLPQSQTQVRWHCKYTVSQKTPTILFVHNFAKCWPIFKIRSLLDATSSLQKNRGFVKAIQKSSRSSVSYVLRQTDGGNTSTVHLIVDHLMISNLQQA